MADRKPIADATTGELRRYAELAFGLEVDTKLGKDRVLALLRRAGFGADEIIVYPDRNPEAAVATTGDGRIPASCMKVVNGRKYVSVLIPTQEIAGGEEPVQVGVNGRIMFIPRAEPCWIPAEYEEVLHHSQRRVYDEFRDGEGGLDLAKSRVVQEYPYQFVPPVHPEPLAA